MKLDGMGKLAIEKKLNAAIKALGAPHEGDQAQKRARSKLLRRLNEAKRTVRELEGLAKGK